MPSNCETCPFKGQPKVGPEGNPRECRYVLIGEAPARDEVRLGRPFIGATGRLLNKFLEREGIKREECYITNSLLCQLPQSKRGISEALRHCRPRLFEELAAINTGATIAVMGGIARDALYPSEKGGILASRGWRTWNGRQVLVMAHPAYFLYNPDQAPMLVKDLKRLKRGRQDPIGPFEIARAIPLTNTNKVAWVSEGDYRYLKEAGTWHVQSRGYCGTGSDNLMHRWILERKGHEMSHLQGDHRNRNRLDNRRSNLRTATLEQQAQNHPPKPGTTSCHKGVYFAAKARKWAAEICNEGEGVFLGYFKTEEEAARVYDAAAKEAYGEYAYLNFPEKKPEWTAWVLDSVGLLRKFVDDLREGRIEHGKYLSFDLEAMQVDFQRDRILCLGIATKEGTAYIVPDSVLYEDGHAFVTSSWSKRKWEVFLSDERYRTGSYLRPNAEVVDLLSEMFTLPRIVWAGHVMKFDLRFLVGQLGVTAPVSIADTVVMHYTLDERRGGHGLKALADDMFDTGDYEAELFNYIDKKSGHYSNIPRHVLYGYCAMDVELTLRFAYTFEEELRKEGLYGRPYLFPMMAAVPMLLAAELYGVGIDWEELERIDREEIEPELQKVAVELRRISGIPFLNPMSSQKVNDILYDQFKFPIIEVRTRAAGKRIKERSSQKAVLDGWRQMWEEGRLRVSEEAWQFAEMLGYYRHVRKMRGSYARKWPNFRGLDDRVHTSYYLRGTVTGRLSSADPPMQTVPSKEKDKWGTLIANAHIPAKGWSFVYADYSQAELMVAACLSGDEFMLQSFQKEDADYHNEVALAAYGPNFTRDDRQACKRITFGWLFGGNVKEIAMKALQFQGPVAERFAHEWDDLFGTLVIWRKKQGELMLKQGYVESIFGRRRRYYLLTDRNYGKAQRVAINSPIQSAVSDLNLISATKLYHIYEDAWYAHVILLIHDSTVLEVKDEYVPEVSEMMQKVMLETAAEYFPQVPFKADTKVGKHLGDLT